MTSHHRPEGPDRDDTSREVRIPEAERADLDRYLSEYTRVLDKRLEDGLAEIQRAAAKLMRHLAAEVWQAAGPEAGRTMRESVLATLAQNDAIRGLLTHTDERFQSLQARVGEVEGHIRQLAEATREAVHQVKQSDPGADAQERRALAGVTARAERQLTELAERSEQLQGEIQQELRRVESAIRGELAEGLVSARAEIRERIEQATAEARQIRERIEKTEAEAAEGRTRIERAVAEAGRRTGVVLDGLRTDLQARLEQISAGGPGAGERLEALATDLAERLDRLEAAQDAQRTEIEAYTIKAGDWVGDVARKLHGEIGKLAERAEAAEARTGERSERLEEIVRGFHQEVEAFRQRAGQGLSDVGQRIRDGFELMVNRSIDQQRRALSEVEAALRQDLIDLHRDILQVAGRTGTVLDGIHADLIKRLEGAEGSVREEAVQLVAQVVGRHAGQQGRNLQAITESLRALLDAVRRSGSEQAQVLERVLRASAGRQEALLDESLSALKATLEELGGLRAEGRPIRPEDAGAFTRRLRGVEERLERLSRELGSELPSSS